MTKSITNSILPLVISELMSHIDEIRETYKVSRIGVFGSISREEDSPESDVDILIDFIPGKVKYRAFIGLADALEQILSRPVDLITVNSLSPYMRPVIEKEVIWIYE
ncbi:MAG: nucleotidyltransferase family protein [Methanoregula sp.]|jgi:hypothetical protein